MTLNDCSHQKCGGGCKGSSILLEEQAIDSPNRNNVWEQEEKSYDLKIPTASKMLKRHHDKRDHDKSPKQDLRKTVHFQIKETDLKNEIETFQSH